MPKAETTYSFIRQLCGNAHCEEFKGEKPEALLAAVNGIMRMGNRPSSVVVSKQVGNQEGIYQILSQKEAELDPEVMKHVKDFREGVILTLDGHICTFA